ncbi:MAG: hypothetical protein JWO62_3126 [Acidimicrobiaceae bacterium]|nr:hypothetical protein [Acidimicrobiaceae bacterium]
MAPKPGATDTIVSIVVISKDEPALADTLERLSDQAAAVASRIPGQVEVVVVDASSGRLDAVRDAHPSARWIDFTRPEGVRVSIPHQRNAGVREAQGDVIVFTDCGCIPGEAWLERLLEPILSGSEQMTCGRTGASGAVDPYNRETSDTTRYLDECPTINLAFRRQVFDDVGGFDETFEYGSDVDFSWRAVHRGFPIRYVPGALVLHDWGSRRRQAKRSFAYGKARARLYRKHILGNSDQSITKRRLGANDAVPILYPLFILGLPLSLRYRSYLLLLLIPLWRSRHDRPLDSLVNHLILGAGVISGTREMLVSSRR